MWPWNKVKATETVTVVWMVKLHKYYHHKFDIYLIYKYSAQENHNVKVLDTAGQTALHRSLHSTSVQLGNATTTKTKH